MPRYRRRAITPTFIIPTPGPIVIPDYFIKNRMIDDLQIDERVIEDLTIGLNKLHPSVLLRIDQPGIIPNNSIDSQHIVPGAIDSTHMSEEFLATINDTWFGNEQTDTLILNQNDGFKNIGFWDTFWVGARAFIINVIAEVENLTQQMFIGTLNIYSGGTVAGVGAKLVGQLRIGEHFQGTGPDFINFAVPGAGQFLLQPSTGTEGAGYVLFKIVNSSTPTKNIKLTVHAAGIIQPKKINPLN